LLFVGVLLVISTPSTASAGVFSIINDFFSKNDTEQVGPNNSQTLHILQAVTGPVGQNLPRGGGDITVVGGVALLSDTGPSGTQVEVDENPVPVSGQVSTYTVREGDTLSSIAKMFDVSVGTVLSANDLKRGDSLVIGQKLVILPVSGIQYTVKKGDTISSIAKKYKVDVGEIIGFNGFTLESDELTVGESIIIPFAEVEQKVTTSTSKKKVSNKAHGTGGPDYTGYYMRPVSVDFGRKSQGLHGYNGIDIAGPTGTPIVASASGEVIVAKRGGWNGGYGSYVVIAHDNGTQTLYGHMSAVTAQEGWHVSKGQLIGYVGSTGRSTGSHLHFEVRGAKNPF
jgi:murein DD-endopeptidase MepM/ murein hydrolase activator NlpD